MSGNDVKVAMLCSIALFEFSVHHKKDLPEMAIVAREISVSIDDIVMSSLFEKEN